MASYLVCFYTVTLGENGDTLGADEEDVVLLQYLVFDVAAGKSVIEQQYVVCPNEDVNESQLSEQFKTDFGLTLEQIRAGVSLESAINSFESVACKLMEDNAKVYLVTDGQLHLRQVLHPKSVAKGFTLPQFYHAFHDLRKAFKSFFHFDSELRSIRDMADYLELVPEMHTNMAVRSVREMAKIIQRMSTGHKFSDPEVIHSRLESGICTKGEEVDSGCVVRARGLPWQSSDQDIAKFFRGLNIAKGGVALCLSLQGRRNGEALVRFESCEHRDMAIKRHKHHIGNRYIEVYKSTGEDFISVAGGNNNEAQQFLSRGGQVIIRMRGLPYDCTAKQVVEFFETGDNPCKILDNEEGVLFVRKPDGRATGDAFVLFASEDDSAAALTKHREIIGSRYIELFRSTTAEVQQVLNRSMDPKTYEQQQPLIGQIPRVPILPQQFITASSRKDCIRLRGLPYEAQVEHVLEFLGEHAKSIVFRGVHMVINPQGQPSGEAFIQMESEQSAFVAAQNRHHRYMVFGKKQRYIEVFQCSGEDMNLVLSGGIPAQRSVVSPGMLLWDQSGGASAVAQATPSSSALFSHAAPRPLSAGVTAVLPTSLASSFPTPNASLYPGLLPPQLKQGAESFWMAPPMLPQAPIRHAVIPPPQLDLQTLQQNQASALVGYKPSVSSASIASPFIGQYGEVSFGAAAMPPGMVLVSNAKASGTYVHSVSQSQMPMVASSSPLDHRKQPLTYTTQKSLSFPSVLHLPMQPAYQAGVNPANLRPLTPAVQTHSKRSFEQAFPGDKSTAVRPFKRPPPRIPAPQIASPALGIPQLAQPQLPPTQLAISPQLPVGAVSMPPPYPMLPSAFYPQHLYPPAV